MRRGRTIGEGHGARWLGIVSIVVVLLMAGTAHASYVTITSPSDGASIAGAVSINTSIGSGTVWINVYVDGHYFASGSPSSFTWDSTSVSNGTHTISAKAYLAPGVVLGTAAIGTRMCSMLAWTCFASTLFRSRGTTIRREWS